LVLQHDGRPMNGGSDGECDVVGEMMYHLRAEASA